jgi:hypothetical protein
MGKVMVYVPIYFIGLSPEEETELRKSTDGKYKILLGNYPLSVGPCHSSGG